MTEKQIPGIEMVKDRLTEEFVLAYMHQHMPVASQADIGMMAFNSGMTGDRKPNVGRTNEVTEALLRQGHITDVKSAFELPAHGGVLGLMEAIKFELTPQGKAAAANALTGFDLKSQLLWRAERAGKDGLPREQHVTGHSRDSASRAFDELVALGMMSAEATSGFRVDRERHVQANSGSAGHVTPAGREYRNTLFCLGVG